MTPQPDAGMAPQPPPVAQLRVPGHAGGPAPSGLWIPASELTWRFSSSGGAGGQHVNTSNSRAEVVFDIAASPSLPAEAKALLLSRLGPSVAVAASDRRSQLRNRDLALERLAAKLSEALAVQRSRRPTRPTAGSKARRLQAKRHRSQQKQDRRNPADDG